MQPISHVWMNVSSYDLLILYESDASSSCRTLKTCTPILFDWQFWQSCCCIWKQNIILECKYMFTHDQYRWAEAIRSIDQEYESIYPSVKWERRRLRWSSRLNQRLDQRERQDYKLKSTRCKIKVLVPTNIRFVWR